MGNYRKRLQGETGYVSFVLTPLASLEVDIKPLEELIKETEATLGQLDMTISKMTEENVLEVIQKEAEDSCELATGKCFSLFGLPGSFSGWKNRELMEVTHLVDAISYAVETLGVLPISGRLLKNAHYLMCRSPRYEKKYPGEFRTSPVWLGKEGCMLKEAMFIPPTDEDMIDAFSELEKFINEETNMNLLIRAALVHYQFEAIHPFIDANGRVGRLLNTLFLLENGIIRKPVLRWSHILAKYAVRYYAELQHVHETGRYENWIRFFLLSLKEAAETSEYFSSVVKHS